MCPPSPCAPRTKASPGLTTTGGCATDIERSLNYEIGVAPQMEKTAAQSPPARSERGERTRTKILEAATELFADEGYFAVSTRDIAKRAGISTGLAYHYFESKEDLLAAQMHYLAEIWQRKVEDHVEATPDADLRSRVVDHVMVMRRFIREDHPHYFRFYVKHSVLPNLPHRERFDAYARISEAWFTSWIARGRKTQEIRREVDDTTALFVLYTVINRLQAVFDRDAPDEDAALTSDDEATVRERVRVITDLLLAGILDASLEAGAA